MLELNKNDYPRVASIFSNIYNSLPVVFCVIDGNNNGRIYVDNTRNPKTALVILSDMLFFGGQRNTRFCQEAFVLLMNDIFQKTDADYFDCYCLSDELREDIEFIFASKIHGKPVRKTFTFDKDAFAQHMDWRAKVPDGFRMNYIDEDFVDMFHYDKDILIPSLKRFGYALVNEDEIVCECTACFVGGGQAEISVHTNEAYRSRGFAIITCAAFIEHCLSTGLLPNWGCWDFRETSVALAKRLGFKEKSNDIVFGLKK